MLEKWGACVCMGFIYIRAGAIGLDFAAGIESYLQGLVATEDKEEEQPDDQKAANYVLNDWQLMWPGQLSVEDRCVGSYSKVA